MHTTPADEQPLDARERDALRSALGVPKAEHVLRAIDEVERQVATEDLLILMVDSAAGAARAFFDVLIEVLSPQDAAAAQRAREDRGS